MKNQLQEHDPFPYRKTKVSPWSSRQKGPRCLHACGPWVSGSSSEQLYLGSCDVSREEGLNSECNTMAPLSPSPPARRTHWNHSLAVTHVTQADFTEGLCHHHSPDWRRVSPRMPSCMHVHTASTHTFPRVDLRTYSERHSPPALRRTVLLSSVAARHR